MKANYLKVLLAIFVLGFISLPAIAQNEASEADTIIVSKPDLERWGEDSATCVRNYSLYREYYRNYSKSKESGKLDEAKEYIKSAVAPWRYVFNNCPVASQNLYRDGAQIIKYLYNNADDDQKAAYADTLMMVYNQRLDMYGWKEGIGYILGRKAVDHMKFKSAEREKNYEIFEEAYNYSEIGNFDPAVLFYHVVSAINLFKTGKAEKDLIIDSYLKVSSVYEKSIEQKVDNYKSFKSLNPRVEKLVEPFLDCPALISMFEKKLEENPDDVKLLKKASSMLNSKGCTDSDLYFTATKRLHKVEPNAESAYLMGKMAVKREMYDEAAKYLQEAATTLEDTGKTIDAYILLGNVNSIRGHYSKARENAYSALEYDPNNGDAYMLIGDLYANSAERCTGDDEVASKSIYWAAVDKYQKAKSVDPEVAEQAQAKINKFSNYFPSQESIFFNNLSEGNSYEVGCWINETTTVRAR